MFRLARFVFDIDGQPLPVPCKAAGSDGRGPVELEGDPIFLIDLTRVRRYLLGHLLEKALIRTDVFLWFAYQA